MMITENSHLLAQHLPNSQLRIYPDSGHGFLDQYPELSPTTSARSSTADEMLATLNLRREGGVVFTEIAAPPAQPAGTRS